jgi:hypothetical protein
MVDEPVSKVSTKSLIKGDAEFLLNSLLEAPGVNVWSGMCTLFNNLIWGGCGPVVSFLKRCRVRSNRQIRCDSLDPPSSTQSIARFLGHSHNEGGLQGHQLVPQSEILFLSA